MLTQDMVRKQHKALDQLGIAHRFDDYPEGTDIVFVTGCWLSDTIQMDWNQHFGLMVYPPHTVIIPGDIDDILAGLNRFKEICDAVTALG